MTGVAGRAGFSLLGPYPGNSSFSIGRYFDFYRRNFSEMFGADFAAFCPGGSLCEPEQRVSLAPRLEAWRRNYVEWPIQLTGLDSDLFHIVDQGLFWYARFLRGGKRVGTVHDLIAYFVSSGTLPLGRSSWRTSLLLRENINQLKRLDHAISVSEFTAHCLIREQLLPPDRVTVVHNHVDSRFTPPCNETRKKDRNKWFPGEEFAVIHVGRPLIYKNRLGAIRAFALLHQRMPSARMSLVNGACTDEERSFIAEARLGETIRFIPAVTNDELREIYGAADALIFPSYYEGFGWPPVEAMACGCPVVSSTRASLREVVGDAALTVEDPDDHQLLASHLTDILTSTAMANDLRARGLARVRRFSPEAALTRVTDVYRMLGR